MIANGDSSLIDRIQHHVAERAASLPVFSDVALEVQRVVRNEDCTAEEVSRLIQRDQALASGVLRAANSSFYGGLASIRTVQNAIVRLGLEQVTQMVFLASEQSKYSLQNPAWTEHANVLWRHAAGTAMAAQWLARKLRFARLVEEAFLGGLIHDIGDLAILTGIDALWATEKLDVPPALIAEVIANTHTTVGAELATRWNLPDVYVHIVRDHHSPQIDPSDTSMNLVRLADRVTHKVGAAFDPDPSLDLGATEEAQALGASEVLLAELEIVVEDWLGSLQAN
jgi:putative nucleotidyltransferase with HDIG domain